MSASSRDTDANGCSGQEFLLAQPREKNLDGTRLGDAFRCLPRESIHHVKSAVLHLLWRQELLIDLSEPLSGRTELRRPE